MSKGWERMKHPKTIQTLVRLPLDLRRYLERQAKQQHRSLSAEILLRLENSLHVEQQRRASNI